MDYGSPEETLPLEQELEMHLDAYVAERDLQNKQLNSEPPDFTMFEPEQ